MEVRSSSWSPAREKGRGGSGGGQMEGRTGGKRRKKGKIDLNYEFSLTFGTDLHTFLISAVVTNQVEIRHHVLLDMFKRLNLFRHYSQK